MIKRSVFGVLIGLLVMPLGTLAAELDYVGSSIIASSILKAGAVATFEAKSGIKFGKIDAGGTGKGIQAVLDGQAQIAGSGRTLKPEEKKAKLVSTIIGYDAIAIFVHKDNPVKNLTKAQLKGIFAGQIKNWKEVGGKDAAITLMTEPLASKRATVEMIQEKVLDGASFGSGFKEVDQQLDQLVNLASSPSSICPVSLGMLSVAAADVRAKIKTIAVGGVEPNEKSVRSGSYLLSRPMLLVTKGLPKAEAKAFIDFILSSEGQSIVAKSLVPVRK